MSDYYRLSHNIGQRSLVTKPKYIVIWIVLFFLSCNEKKTLQKTPQKKSCHGIKYGSYKYRKTFKDSEYEH